ncbi:MAG: hypothetical protein ACE5RC_00010 [Nitrosopumilus sp.]
MTIENVGKRFNDDYRDEYREKKKMKIVDLLDENKTIHDIYVSSHFDMKKLRKDIGDMNLKIKNFKNQK